MPLARKPNSACGTCPISAYLFLDFFSASIRALSRLPCWYPLFRASRSFIIGPSLSNTAGAGLLVKSSVITFRFSRVLIFCHQFSLPILYVASLQTQANPFPKALELREDLILF